METYGPYKGYTLTIEMIGRESETGLYGRRP
jgi:hypothetical protein